MLVVLPTKSDDTENGSGIGIRDADARGVLALTSGGGDNPRTSAAFSEESRITGDEFCVVGIDSASRVSSFAFENEYFLRSLATLSFLLANRGFGATGSVTARFCWLCIVFVGFTKGIAGWMYALACRFILWGEESAGSRGIGLCSYLSLLVARPAPNCSPLEDRCCSCCDCAQELGPGVRGFLHKASGKYSMGCFWSAIARSCKSTFGPAV